MISSISSFSMIGHGGDLLSLNIFLKMGVPHGFWMLISMEFLMKLKNALRLEYLLRLVVCLFPSVILVRKERISSGVMDSSSLSLNSSENWG